MCEPFSCLIDGFQLPFGVLPASGPRVMKQQSATSSASPSAYRVALAVPHRSFPPLRDTLEPAFQVVECAGGNRLYRALESANCALVVPRSEILSALAEFAAARRCPPLLVICRDEPLEPVAQIVFRTVRPEETGERVMAVVTEAVIEDVLDRCRAAAGRIAGWHGGSRNLASALARLFDVPPLHSVTACAQSADCSVRHLEVLWLGCQVRPSQVLLKDLVSATLVLRALVLWLRDREQSWRAIASQLGVSGRTLRDHLRRSVGLLPRDISLRRIPDVVAGLEGTVLHAVLSLGGGVEREGDTRR